MTSEIELYAGNDRSFTLPITADAAALDLTGYDLYFTAKRRMTDADDDALIALDTTIGGGITVTDALGGMIKVDIGRALTADITADTRLRWDLRLVDTATGNERTLPEPMVGVLIVRAPVRRSVAP